MNSDKNKVASFENPANKEEKKLLTRIKQKDKDAFITAYDLYVDQIYRFVYFKISDKEEAQDLTSTIFLKAWNYIQQNSISDFKTVRGLLYRIARTTVIDYYRKNSGQENITLDNEENPIQISDEKEKILEKAEKSSDMELVESNLKKIKEEYREVIILKYLEDLSTSEIANILDKSRGNTRVIIHRALNALKKIIEEENEK